VTSLTNRAPITRAKVISIASHAVASPRVVNDGANDYTAPSLTDETLAIGALIELPIEPRDVSSHKRAPRLPVARLNRPLPPRARTKAARSVLTGYYISRDTIYGPERSGEFYVRGERIYLSRRALAGRARIPGASVREVGRVLGDLAGMPRSTGTVANRIATRDLAPIPTGYFTINGRIYGGLGRASDPIAGIQRAGDVAPPLNSPAGEFTPRNAGGVTNVPLRASNASRPSQSVAAQLAKGEFRIVSNLIYVPPGQRVPWLLATDAASKRSEVHVSTRRARNAGSIHDASTRRRAAHSTKPKRAKKLARRPRPKAA